MRICRCDKCGKEIKLIHKSDLKVKGTKYQLEGYLFWRVPKEIDCEYEYELCTDCSEKLLEWLGKIQKI